uniref:Uncharacterized protein n=1 Tax=Auxenochlorella protothecoides TaxID=3075 RepID=A0A1D2A4F3_AUXPR
MSPGCVVAMDGRLLALDPPTPSSYLAQAPRGAYTALRLPRPFFAVDWAQHVARLEQSIGLLHEAGLVDYGAWHGMESEKGNTLADLLLPTAHSALSALPAPGGPACLVLLACPGAPLQVHAVAQPLAADPYCTVPPGWAAVLGPGRALPLAKDSAWVRERAPLEGLRRPGAVEVLLANAAGGLLEGLVTNFFVISGPATASQRASDYTLQTAGEKDGVLAGTARRAALRAAAACGLTVLEQPPDPSHRSAWREAFLTNSLRGCQNLTRIVRPGHWAVDLPPFRPWTAAICALLTKGEGGVNLRRPALEGTPGP